MIKEKLEKRYKVVRWIQYIAFGLSVASCFIPLMVSCIRVVPTVQTAEQKLSIGGIAVIITAIIACVALRSLIRKFIDKIPYTLLVLAISAALLVLVICLKTIMDDAIAVLWVAAISSAIAFVLELLSMFCKAMAEYTKEEYGRIKDDVQN